MTTSHKPPPTARRNADILKMRQAGLTLRKIANYHNLAAWTVLQIVRREEKKAEWAKRAMRLQQVCLETNDIDRKIPIDDLLCLFSFPTRINEAVRNHLRANGVQEYSLLEMMEFLIPKVRSSNICHQVMPACVIAGIGLKHYATMIRKMSSVDCGVRFQREWEERKILLRAYLTGVGKGWQRLRSRLKVQKVRELSFPLAATNKKVHILLPKGEEMLLWNAKTSPRSPAHPSFPDCFLPAGTMPPVNEKILDTHP